MYSRTDREAGGSCNNGPTGKVQSYHKWQYDTATNGLGQLASVTASNSVGGAVTYSEAYSYDGLGRPYQTATQFANHKGSQETHYQKTTFDQYGRVFQTFDAARAGEDFNRNGVQNRYNDQGYLYEVVEAAVKDGAQASYYKVASMDARGNVQAAEYGNGVDQVNRYWHRSRRSL